MAENHQAGGRPIDPLLTRSLKGEASPEEEAAVREWRRASPENDVEYRELSRLAEWSGRVNDLVAVPPRPAAAELIHRSDRDRRVVPPRRRLLRWGAAWLTAAAAAALLAFGGYVYASRGLHATAFGVREIVTSPSETATLELLDGTVLRLAPSSRLRVLLERGRREVALEGRGFFAVAHDGTPFLIRTEAGEVTVLGTRLDLEARGRDLRLVVVQGRVALSTGSGRKEVAAGEMGRIHNGEPTPVVRVPDIGSVVDWTGNFLAFESTPLRDAAHEIERVYGVRVEIPNEELARRVITAWFRDKSVAEVVDVVCLAVAARCTIEHRVVRMVPDTLNRQPPSAAGRDRSIR